MQYSAMAAYIGLTVRVKLSGLWIYGTVKDVRKAYGRLDYQIVTKEGSAKWVDSLNCVTTSGMDK